MHDPTSLPTPEDVRTARPAPRRRQRRLPLSLLLLAGAVSGAAFITLIEAPLPEEIVLASLEQALGSGANPAR
jgi:hypothetical protein